MWWRNSWIVCKRSRLLEFRDRLCRKFMLFPGSEPYPTRNACCFCSNRCYDFLLPLLSLQAQTFLYQVEQALAMSKQYKLFSTPIVITHQPHFQHTSPYPNPTHWCSSLQQLIMWARAKRKHPAHEVRGAWWQCQRWNEEMKSSAQEIILPSCVTPQSTHFQSSQQEDYWCSNSPSLRGKYQRLLISTNPLLFQIRLRITINTCIEIKTTFNTF